MGLGGAVGCLFVFNKPAWCKWILKTIPRRALKSGFCSVAFRILVLGKNLRKKANKLCKRAGMQFPSGSSS